jgi:hypothetical protein
MIQVVRSPFFTAKSLDATLHSTRKAHWKIIHDPDCPYHTKDKHNLQKHLHGLHDPDIQTLTCPEPGCDSTFTSQCDSDRHWKTVHDPDSPTFPCLI